MTKKSSTVCIDSNLAVRLILGGPQVEEVRTQWKQWINENKKLIAPPLFALEVTSVIQREVYFDRLTIEQRRQALQVALAQEVHLKYLPNLHKQAFEIAHRFGLSQAYDAHFVALAKRSYASPYWMMINTPIMSATRKLPTLQSAHTSAPKTTNSEPVEKHLQRKRDIEQSWSSLILAKSGDFC